MVVITGSVGVGGYFGARLAERSGVADFRSNKLEKTTPRFMI